MCCNAHSDAPLIEDYRAGDQICSECGLVVCYRVIDVGSEWRKFSNEEAGADPSRVGGPENPLLNGSDLSTVIGPGRGDAFFDGFGISKYQNRRNMNSSDRALINAFREITSMADRINLPKTIVDRANYLFKQVHDGRNLKGRANDAIASTCLYIACRQEGAPRTFNEIRAVSKISKKEIGRCFKLILKALEISVDLITAGDFMPRFCSNLGLSNKVQRVATHIARKAVELDIVPGRSPISVAAAAIYMASQASEDKRNQKEIGDIAGVADVTVRESYKLMYPHAAKLFPEDFRFTTREASSSQAPLSQHTVTLLPDNLCLTFGLFTTPSVSSSSPTLLHLKQPSPRGVMWEPPTRTSISTCPLLCNGFLILIPW
jgi:transcription initiation factor TFIIB